MDRMEAAGQVPCKETAAGGQLNDALLPGRRPASQRMQAKVGRKASNAEHPSHSKTAGAGAAPKAEVHAVLIQAQHHRPHQLRAQPVEPAQRGGAAYRRQMLRKQTSVNSRELS